EGTVEDARGDFEVLQLLLGLRPARGVPADADDLVERRDGDELPFEDVGTPLGLAEQELGAPADHLDAVADELLEHLLEPQLARPAIDERQEDEADGLLQRRMLVELIQDEVRVPVAFHVKDDADRLAAAGARLVADGGDALDLLVLDQLADLRG